MRNDDHHDRDDHAIGRFFEATLEFLGECACECMGECICGMLS